MRSSYKFSILSPGGKTFEGEVEHVAAPGAKGRFGVLPGHAPMIAIVQPGLCLVRANGINRPFYTGEGVLEVSREEVVMLVDEAQALDRPEDAKSLVAERKRRLAGGKRS
jgi:F-type H+-transporting ATPase subunit epsilon